MRQASTPALVAKRFIQGILIGLGWVMPGISGGLLAMIFGIYGQIIALISNPLKRFKETLPTLLPVAAGSCAGIFLFAVGFGALIERNESTVTWLFIGCVICTIPSLAAEAKLRRITLTGGLILVLSFAAMWILPLIGQTEGDAAPFTFLRGLLIGAIIGAGSVVPGVSSSAVLLSIGSYDTLLKAASDLDVLKLIPIGIGFLLCIALFSKIIGYLLANYRMQMYCMILGLASATALIMARSSLSAGFSFGSVLFFAAGIALSLIFELLGKKYPH